MADGVDTERYPWRFAGRMWLALALGFLTAMLALWAYIGRGSIAGVPTVLWFLVAAVAVAVVVTWPALTGRRAAGRRED